MAPECQKSCADCEVRQWFDRLSFQTGMDSRQCFSCKGFGHVRRNCPLGATNRGRVASQTHNAALGGQRPARRAVRCYECNELGHFKSQCPVLKGRSEAASVENICSNERSNSHSLQDQKPAAASSEPETAVIRHADACSDNGSNGKRESNGDGKVERPPADVDASLPEGGAGKTADGALVAEGVQTQALAMAEVDPGTDCGALSLTPDATVETTVEVVRTKESQAFDEDPALTGCVGEDPRSADVVSPSGVADCHDRTDDVQTMSPSCFDGNPQPSLPETTSVNNENLDQNKPEDDGCACGETTSHREMAGAETLPFAGMEVGDQEEPKDYAHRPKSEMTCFICGQTGHKRRDCPQSSRQRQRRTGKRHQAVYDYPTTTGEVIDTHCHIEYVMERFRCSSYRNFIDRHPPPASLSGAISSFCDPGAFSDALGLWPELVAFDGVYASFGLHPHHAKYYTPALEEKILTACTHPKAVALGEIGLDYSDHCPSTKAEQVTAFRRLLTLARQLEKPVVVHCSAGAEEDLYKCLSEELPRYWKIHLHCYAGTWRMAQRFVEAFENVYFGFTGLVTYRRADDVREVATNLPVERILLETDAPYLPPFVREVPKGERWSVPAMVLFVAQEVARLRGVDLDALLRSVRQNTTLMYSI